MKHERIRRGAQRFMATGLGLLKNRGNMIIPHEPLFLNPQVVRFAFSVKGPSDPFFMSHLASGSVLEGDWDRNVIPVGEQWKYRAVVRRFRDGMSWEETGIIDHMMRLVEKHNGFDELHSRRDVEARYESVDRLYDDVCATGRMKTRKELGATWWSERGGIYGHLDRNGEFLRFRNGNHRFGIAVCAGLETIPVDVGLVHPDAIVNGVIPKMRER